MFHACVACWLTVRCRHGLWTSCNGLSLKALLPLCPPGSTAANVLPLEERARAPSQCPKRCRTCYRHAMQGHAMPPWATPTRKPDMIAQVNTGTSHRSRHVIYCKTDGCPAEHPPGGPRTRSHMRSVCRPRPQEFAAQFPVSRDPPLFTHRCTPHQGRANAAHRRLRADTRSTREPQTGGLMLDFDPLVPARVTGRHYPSQREVGFDPLTRA